MYKFVLNKPLLVSAALAALFILPHTSLAVPIAPVGSFARINSFTSVTDSEPDRVENDTGAAVEVGVAGSQVGAYSNGRRGRRAFTFKPTTDDVFARSSLETGELKARAMLEFGSNRFGSAFMPVGQTNSAASASAGFRDRFSTFSGDTPFLWRDGETATFNMAITGRSDVPDGLAIPESFDPGETKNNIGTSLYLFIYEPGAFEFIEQRRNFDWGAFDNFDEAIAASRAISEQIHIIDWKTWFLGEQISPFDNPSLAVDPFIPTEISFEFTPGGDFEWELGLSTWIHLDASLENVSASLDFSNTIVTSYAGPTGTSTFSASGLFPDTLALNAAPPETVPEPSTWALIGSGLIGLFFMRRPARHNG